MLLKKALLSALSLVLVATVLGQSATEASILVGDNIRFIDQNGTNGGGEFGVAKLPNVNTELFRTFCLEKNEFIDFDAAGFRVDDISTSAVGGGIGGGNPDPISASTAWLYYKFATGALAGYNYGTDASANELQDAIWHLEQEITLGSPNSNQFINAANSASSAELAFAVTRTRVLNISWATARGDFGQGQAAQSMLYVIPEPGSFLVWGVLGLAGVGLTNRRRKS
jgi:hypothetical protein